VPFIQEDFQVDFDPSYYQCYFGHRNLALSSSLDAAKLHYQSDALLSDPVMIQPIATVVPVIADTKQQDFDEIVDLTALQVSIKIQVIN
jgi:hypothetical protein